MTAEMASLQAVKATTTTTTTTEAEAKAGWAEESREKAG